MFSRGGRGSRGSRGGFQPTFAQSSQTQTSEPTEQPKNGDDTPKQNGDSYVSRSKHTFGVNSSAPAAAEQNDESNGEGGAAPRGNSNQQSRGGLNRGRGRGGSGGFGRGSNSVPVGENQDGNEQEGSQKSPRREPRPSGGDRPPRPPRRDYEPNMNTPTDGYKPKVREVAAIFEQDELNKELYGDAFDNDEDVTVENCQSQLKIDSWNEIKWNDHVKTNIERAGYVRPRKIQSHTIPYILEGSDLIAQAETGSGKSAAFLIPLIHKISSKIENKKIGENDCQDYPFAMIVEPTRELALQVYEQARKFASGTGVRVVAAYGEYNVKENSEAITRGCDIVVGTPGRILHFLEASMLGIGLLEYVVLDEADRLLDDRFGSVLDKIVNFVRHYSKNREEKHIQVMLFSATFPDRLENFGRNVLRQDYVRVRNERPSMPNMRIAQTFQNCLGEDKKILMFDYCKNILNLAAAQKQAAEAEKKKPEVEGEEKSEVETAEKPNGEVEKPKDGKPVESPRILVFTATKAKSDAFAFYLNHHKICSLSLNSDRPQRWRESALEKFRKGEISVLVATDCCARGLDIRELNHVLNFDMPASSTTYVQRIGRTGRLHQGHAHSFFDPIADRELARDMIRLMQLDNIEVPDFIADCVRPQTQNSWAPPPPAGFGTRKEVAESRGSLVDETPAVDFSQLSQNDGKSGFDF